MQGGRENKVPHIRPILSFLTRVVHQRSLPVSLLYFIVVGILAHTKDLVVVLPLALLELKLGLLEAPEQSKEERKETCEKMRNT